jgi:general secretion pathway protein I
MSSLAVIKTRSQQSGFTLLEVMVALAIFAVAAVALTQAGMSYVNAVQSLETRTLAHFVAMNKAASININQTWLEGSGEDNVEEQGRHWMISTEASTLPFSQDVRRVLIKIAPIEPGNEKPGDAVTSMVIFIQRPSGQ